MFGFDSSLRALIGRSEKATDRGQINFALRINHDFVEWIFTEKWPREVAQTIGTSL